jgi:hypothetical protein
VVPVLERCWSRSLRAHLAALAVVLLALTPWLGTSRLFSADEGALVAQAHQLSSGRGWYVDHPRPDLDDDGRFFPIHLSQIDVEGDRGAPFAKHPLYPVLLAPLDALGGKTAMVLVSLAGTLAAALVAALLARRLRPGLERPTLWVVGLASPLFLDGYVLVAHTIGAALAGLAVLLAIEDHRNWRRVAGIVVVLALAVAFRSEALLFGLALAAACGVLAWWRRYRSLVWPALAALVGTIAGKALDQALGALVCSAYATVNPTAGSSNFLGDRVFGAVVTWLLPSYDGLGLDDALLVGALVLGVATVVVARRRPEDGAGIRLLALLGAACAVGRVLVPATAVPGLLVAFPLLAVGLAAVGRPQLQSRTASVALVTCVIFAVAVLGTQYRSGGSGEWGGRYFALALPVIVPVVLAALADLGRRLDEATRRVTVGALLVASLAMTITAGDALYRHQWTSQGVVDAVEAAVAATPDAVVVATDGTTGRFGWRHVLAGEEWLLAGDDGDLAAVGEGLAAEGRPIVLSTFKVDDSLERLGPWYEVAAVLHPGPDDDRAVITLVPR